MIDDPYLEYNMFHLLNLDCQTCHRSQPNESWQIIALEKLDYNPQFPITQRQPSGESWLVRERKKMGGIFEILVLQFSGTRP